MKTRFSFWRRVSVIDSITSSVVKGSLVAFKWTTVGSSMASPRRRK